MSLLLVQGSASHLPLAAESVQCVVTSPPYWGLRNYAGEQREVWGGADAHAHQWLSAGKREGFTGKKRWQHVVNGDGDTGFPSSERGMEAWQHARGRGDDPGAWGDIEQGGFCACGAWYGALGLEPKPDLYVEHMVAIFREVRRVLRKDGTCWINLGDSYAGGRPGARVGTTQSRRRDDEPIPRSDYAIDGLKPKDLVGIPWMVAFALRADGWYLRSDIIWHKPNPMPESVTDRPTKAHEYLFLLSKSERYFYDADAVREPYNTASLSRYDTPMQGTDRNGGQIGGARQPGGVWEPKNELLSPNPAGRNRRTVWTIPTRPYPGAHFATYPEQLVEPCILAGSRSGDVVLDPFNGSGTTGRAAIRHGRSYVGVDIASEYLLEQSKARINDIQHVMAWDAAW